MVTPTEALPHNSFAPLRRLVGDSAEKGSENMAMFILFFLLVTRAVWLVYDLIRWISMYLMAKSIRNKEVLALASMALRVNTSPVVRRMLS